MGTREWELQGTCGTGGLQAGGWAEEKWMPCHHVCNHQAMLEMHNAPLIEVKASMPTGEMVSRGSLDAAIKLAAKIQRSALYFACGGHHLSNVLDMK